LGYAEHAAHPPLDGQDGKEVALGPPPLKVLAAEGAPRERLQRARRALPALVRPPEPLDR